jgi:hypothetical protein
MRFKLLRRRLTISAPRMKVRSAMPWPLQWAGAAIVLGFCGAIALWAFDLGKQIAGVDTGLKDEVADLRDDVAKLRLERDRIQSLLTRPAAPSRSNAPRRSAWPPRCGRSRPRTARCARTWASSRS